jgi:hypothetical protein
MIDHWSVTDDTPYRLHFHACSVLQASTYLHVVFLTRTSAWFSFPAGLFPHRSTSRILRLNSKGSGYHPVGSGSLAPREIKGSTGVVAAECTHTTALASFQALWTPEGPPARCHMSTSKPCGWTGFTEEILLLYGRVAPLKKYGRAHHHSPATNAMLLGAWTTGYHAPFPFRDSSDLNIE